MFSTLFNEVFYRPLYNGLIFLFNLIPFADAGVIVILFTIIVKFILFPLSIKATRAQLEMKSIESDLNLIKEKYKDNKEEQGRKTIELYKEKNINPFSGFFVILVQLPIIIGLYKVFLKSGLPVINTTLLYIFISSPTYIDMKFLNLIDIASKSILLGFIAAITTYFQIKYSTIDITTKGSSTGAPDFTKIFQTQMKYGFPVMVFFISWSVSAAISLYWITSNLFTIAQEIYIRKHIKKLS